MCATIEPGEVCTVWTQVRRTKPGIAGTHFRISRLEYSRCTGVRVLFVYHHLAYHSPLSQYMSPILKRDVGEQLRQAKRLAAAVAGHPPPLEHEYDHISPSPDETWRRSHDGNAYATSSSSRRGIGVDGDEEDTGPPRRSWEGRTYAQSRTSGKGKEKAYMPEGEEEEEAHAMLRDSDDGHEVQANASVGQATRIRSRTMVEWLREEVLTMTPGRWVDLRNLLLEVSLSRLMAVLGS
jgi:hypothetical protein